MNGAEGGVDVEVQHAIPGVGIAGGGVTADIGTGVGMQDVELAGLVDDLRQHGGDALGVQEVDANRERLGADLGAGLGETFLVAVDDGDTGPRLGHGLGACQTDA